MKNSGGKDTVLLFVVLLLALGAVCYLCVIKKNMDNLSEVENELALVEQEKARNDAIIAQAEQLDKQKSDLTNQLGALEGKLLPDLNSASIQRQIYKRFEDAKIPFLVTVENTALNYETVTLPDGTIAQDRVKWSTYKITVSGTDGFLLTHDEGDDIPDEVFYNQLNIPIGDTKTVNQEAKKLGKNSANEFTSSTYVGYDEFVAALKAIQGDNLDYVKISDIEIADVQGFCTYTAAVNVYAYDLINRKSTANMNMSYMTWVGVENIATGGIVGLPSYFGVYSPSYSVPESSPLYHVYLSFLDYDFAENRPFAAWNHWAYEWNLFEDVKDELAKLPSELRMVELQFRMGMMSVEDYNKFYSEYFRVNGGNSTETPDDNTTNRP